MSHEIDHSNGRANMAYVGEKPWHGLGASINPDASIEEWRESAGLAWQIKSTPVMYAPNDEAPRSAGIDRQVLYRSDTAAGLSVVSSYYKPVQPETVLEFFRDLVGDAGFRLSTAGSLKGGRKIWALAEIGKEADVSPGDRVKGNLLLATSCDGSLATTAKFTPVRVICANTLAMATQRGSKDGVKVYHISDFDAADVKKQLGIVSDQWTSFIEAAKVMARVKLNDAKIVSILQKIYATSDDDRALAGDKFLEKSPTSRKIIDLYQGKAIGSNLDGVMGTAWGLVNAATEWFDHRSNSRSDDARMDSAWFGNGAKVKQQVWDACLEVVA